jgi:hypothetical protein
MNQQDPNPIPGAGVTKFLISFEHNVPAMTDAAGNVITPSHPDFGNPDNLHQIVDLVPAGHVGAPPPGMFTEKPIPIGPGPPPLEGLYEYNAELNLDKWFNEKAAGEGENKDNVYWLKIVALVDGIPGVPPQEQPIQWGWHDSQRAGRQAGPYAGWRRTRHRHGARRGRPTARCVAF